MAAREREELNGLYVAMTRAKRHLVFSATEPFQPPPRPSWWQRAQPYAVAVADDIGAAPSRRPDSRSAASLRVLPRRSPRTPAASALAQLPLPFAEDRSRRESSPVQTLRDEGPAKLLGRAVHRLLEWAGGTASSASIAELAAAAAAEFGVAADAVERHGAAILRHAEGLGFFTGSQILWSGNEVAVGDASEVLRIDRLVQLEDATGPTWWVLDYKLHHAPEELAPYRAQLLRYRAVVERAQPGEIVRCAFVTGEGRVVEVA
jgi:ATP-dependent helicase/nuclease subunit A